MIVNNSLDEVKKRESALKIIKEIINEKGRDSLYDVTGLSGGFLASDEELNLLETYVGPAVFEDELQIVGKEHLGGEKVLAVNRTSSGILASILALVEEGSHVSHFLAEFPAHPSIPRSCKIVGASYDEFVDIDKFNIPDNTSLVVVTGSTMDHKVIDEDLFKKVIDMAHEKDIPVLVDDASGARLRTAVFNQPKATDLGADLVVTSTDKLMPGPRGGLMAGREDLINEVKIKANQFGLEAQPPLILAMVNGIKKGFYLNIAGGKVKKSILMAEDIAHLLPLLEEKGGIYNVCDSYQPTFGEISVSVAKQLGKHKPISIPYWMAWCMAKVGNLLGNKAPINTYKLEKMTKSLTFSNEKARKELGWEPLDVLTNYKI